MSQQSKPLMSGAKRAPATGQAENWGRPSGGTDFPLERTGGGFKRDLRKAVFVAGDIPKGCDVTQQDRQKRLAKKHEVREFYGV